MNVKEILELLRNKEFYDAMVWANPYASGTIRYVLDTLYYAILQDTDSEDSDGST